jgi:hypothetical protein
VHSGNGGLVIEVSDIGLGMAESDLRVANTRLQSGGEVNPYTARHMGLFVVGRLAAQHGLVVRLRSTIAGEPNSGTTAGVYIPAEQLGRADAPDQFGGQDYGTPADAHAGIVTALALDEDHATDQPPGQEYVNGHFELPVTLLPQRDPGASGISDIPMSLARPAAGQPEEWPADSMPAQTSEPSEREQPAPGQPSNTSAFFASRTHAAGNGVPQPAAELARHAAHEPSPTAGAGDAIYQKMVSEWLVDPYELANSADLNWEFVWDHGWSAAAAAEDAPVLEHTEEGLPLRQPGARLVPGGLDAAAADGPFNGAHHRNGGAHRSDDRVDEVASAAEFDQGAHSVPLRDPDAVRASISSHFGGVHAGRSHAQETRGTDNE